jgi:hypothetical protein
MEEVLRENKLEFCAEKSTTDRYTLRWKDRPWWAVFMVSEDGFLSVQSDFGDYSYRWPAPGQPFKEFLTDIDTHYLMGKFGRREEFNLTETLIQIQRDILEYRQEESITAEDAREAWDATMRLSNECDEDQSDFYHQLMRDTPILTIVYRGDYTSVPCVNEYPAMLRAFCANIWPAFIDTLKKELTPSPELETA